MYGKSSSRHANYVMSRAKTVYIEIYNDIMRFPASAQLSCYAD